MSTTELELMKMATTSMSLRDLGNTILTPRGKYMKSLDERVCREVLGWHFDANGDQPGWVDPEEGTYALDEWVFNHPELNPEDALPFTTNPELIQALIEKLKKERNLYLTLREDTIGCVATLYHYPLDRETMTPDTAYMAEGDSYGEAIALAALYSCEEFSDENGGEAGN